MILTFDTMCSTVVLDGHAEFFAIADNLFPFLHSDECWFLCVHAFLLSLNLVSKCLLQYLKLRDMSSPVGS